jgi:hypothetical protein
VPPDAVTGVNGVAALPTVSVVLGTACVVVNAGFTVRVADVPATPVPDSVALGTPVGMVLEPDVLDVTSTLKVQVPLAASVPPETESEVAPAMGEKLPQVELAFGVEATVTPLGKETLSATPDNALAFGLVRVKVSVLVPPTVIVVGLADTVTVGGSDGSRMVRLQAVSVLKSPLPIKSQKKLNVADAAPSVELTVIAIGLNSPAAALVWLKVTLA